MQLPNLVGLNDNDETTMMNRIKLDYLASILTQLSLEAGIEYQPEPGYFDYRPADCEFAGVPYSMDFLDVYEIRSNPSKGYDLYRTDASVAFRNTPLFSSVDAAFIKAMAAHWSPENWGGRLIEPDPDFDPEFEAWCEKADNFRHE